MLPDLWISLSEQMLATGERAHISSEQEFKPPAIARELVERGRAVRRSDHVVPLLGQSAHDEASQRVLIFSQ